MNLKTKINLSNYLNQQNMKKIVVNLSKQEMQEQQKSQQDAILDKFESDCMSAPNVAEGLKIAFDNLPDNFLK